MTYWITPKCLSQIYALQFILGRKKSNQEYYFSRYLESESHETALCV